jgi:hypothetical protein
MCSCLMGGLAAGLDRSLIPGKAKWNVLPFPSWLSTQILPA